MANQLRGLSFALFCCLVLVFPFSVAGTNIILGLTLFVGIASGMWWNGARLMWREYRTMILAMLCYWGLMAIGLAWSSDFSWGLHVLGHQWFWLVMPVVVFLFSDERSRYRLMVLLSLGLALHLAFCVLQMFGYVSLIDFGGSNENDATGYIGHIGFGFVYGIWAGLLLNWGWQMSGWERVVAWMLALWALGMIFSAQGRGGYIVALLMVVVVLWRNLRDSVWRDKLLSLGLIIIMASLLATGSGRDRLALTSNEMSAIWHGDVEEANPRIKMWVLSVDAWLDHRVLGVGTGGFPDAAEEVLQKRPSLKFEGFGDYTYAHPHSMYMLSLARWGVVGLGAFLALVLIWIRNGWRLEWGTSFDTPLMALSGIALAMDACFAPTMEQHGTGVFLALMLGLAMSSGAHRRKTGGGMLP